MIMHDTGEYAVTAVQHLPHLQRVHFCMHLACRHTTYHCCSLFTISPIVSVAIQGRTSACAIPDKYAEHIGDAAHEQEGKHEEGQPFCGAPPQVLEDLWNPSCQIGDCHTPTQPLPNVDHFACITTPSASTCQLASLKLVCTESATSTGSVPQQALELIDRPRHQERTLIDA